MKAMREQCIYVAGPYRDYCGRAEYDDEAAIFHGEVIGTRDVITFQAESLDELGEAFQKSVDDYLAFCKETGEPAEKPFSGKFVARLDPELHRRVSMMAQAEGKSLNQVICDCLERLVRESEITPWKPALPPERPRQQRSRRTGRNASRGTAPPIRKRRRREYA